MSQDQPPHGAQPTPPINPAQPTPPINPAQPTPPPVPPVATNPAAAKKNRTMVILSVVGGLLALCCVGGVVIAITANNDDQSAPPEGLVTQPQQQQPAEQPVQDQPPSEEEAQEPDLPPGTITDQGTLIVGTDIEPGTYRGTGCDYWERVSDASGDFDSILANGNVDTGGNLTVTIKDSDFAFNNSCAFLFPIDALRTVEESSTTNEEYGILIVGTDIHPGTWSGTATGHCYWARLSGFTGDFDVILANDNVDAGEKFTITLKPTDAGLELGSDCGPLTKA